MILGVGSQLFFIPERTGTRNTRSVVSSQIPPTPKMSVLCNNGNKIKVGYVGKLDFLDNQASFAEVFGDKPAIISPNIDTFQDYTSTARSLY